jgi:tyrosyl-tRNA synthetase
MKNKIKITKSKKGIYCGFDPTGDSSHIGHLVQIILLLEIFRCLNFKPTAIIGGGTGMIGNPSGKKSEKILLDNQAVLHNVDKIKGHITKLIPNVQIINNADWLKKTILIFF